MFSLKVKVQNSEDRNIWSSEVLNIKAYGSFYLQFFSTSIFFIFRSSDLQIFFFYSQFTSTPFTTSQCKFFNLTKVYINLFFPLQVNNHFSILILASPTKILSSEAIRGFKILFWNLCFLVFLLLR
jgi:hypothetical protein